MNIEEARTKWLNSLILGDHKQGFGRLEDYSGGLCCLGVACKVLQVQYSGSDLNLPPAAQELLGLKTRDPEVMLNGPNGQKLKVKISYCNDGFEMPFRVIARLLREQFAEPEYDGTNPK